MIVRNEEVDVLVQRNGCRIRTRDTNGNWGRLILMVPGQTRLALVEELLADEYGDVGDVSPRDWKTQLSA